MKGVKQAQLDSTLPTNNDNIFYCQIPSHSDCELSTICLNPTCPAQGLICYLCPFTKPHTNHSPNDIIPLQLITRGKIATARHNFAMEIEHQLNNMKETHLRQIRKVKQEMCDTFERYEKKILEEFLVLRSELIGEEAYLLEKLEKKAFKDSENFKKTVQLALKKLIKVDPKQGGKAGEWVCEENFDDFSHLLTNTRAYLLSLQFQYRATREHVTSIMEDTFHFPVLERNVEDYLNKVFFLREEGEDDEEYLKKQRTRIFTFGKKQDLDKIAGFSEANYNIHTPYIINKENNSQIPVIMEENGTDKEECNTARTAGETNEINITSNSPASKLNKAKENNSTNSAKKPSSRKEDAKKKAIESLDTQEDQNNNIELEDFVIIKDSEGGSEFGTSMMETEVRFALGKDGPLMQRILKKPEEKFDAVTLFAKVKDIVLEGFGLYVPLPLEGPLVHLEYRIYEGVGKEGKEIMREEIRFECDIMRVKENFVVETVLLKMPMILEKKKWYTIVLCYLNEVKIAYEGGKWRDVGPFVFLGVEKRQVKEWLGMKTIEKEKMYTEQFPYLIYSENK